MSENEPSEEKWMRLLMWAADRMEKSHPKAGRAGELVQALPELAALGAIVWGLRSAGFPEAGGLFLTFPMIRQLRAGAERVIAAARDRSRAGDPVSMGELRSRAGMELRARWEAPWQSGGVALAVAGHLAEVASERAAPFKGFSGLMKRAGDELKKKAGRAMANEAEQRSRRAEARGKADRWDQGDKSEGAERVAERWAWMWASQGGGLIMSGIRPGRSSDARRRQRALRMSEALSAVERREGWNWTGDPAGAWRRLMEASQEIGVDPEWRPAGEGSPKLIEIAELMLASVSMSAEQKDQGVEAIQRWKALIEARELDREAGGSKSEARAPRKSL